MREGIRVLLAALWPVLTAPTLSTFVARVGVFVPQLSGVDPTTVADVARGMHLPFTEED